MRDYPRSTRAALLALALVRMKDDRHFDMADFYALSDAFTKAMPIFVPARRRQ